MGRATEEFANDISLHDRLKRSVEALAHGKGRQYDRWKLVAEILRPLRARDFPDELRKDYDLISKMLDPKDVRRNPTFKDFSATVVKLYGEICADRGRWRVDR